MEAVLAWLSSLDVVFHHVLQVGSFRCEHHPQPQRAAGWHGALADEPFDLLLRRDTDALQIFP